MADMAIRMACRMAETQGSTAAKAVEGMVARNLRAGGGDGTGIARRGRRRRRRRRRRRDRT